MALLLWPEPFLMLVQAVGAQHLPDARRLGWHGVELGTAIAGLLIYLGRAGLVDLYTPDAVVAAVALAFAARRSGPAGHKAPRVSGWPPPPG